MRVLYIAPRFHNNQVPVVKGWLDSGHEVLFIAQIAEPRLEDYSVLKPVVLGHSPVFARFFSLYTRLVGCRDEDKKFAMYSKAGFPPMSKLRRLITDFGPDIAILRERSVYNIFAYSLLKSLGIKCILYNQTPLYHKPDTHRDPAHFVIRKLSPKVRMTPVYGDSDGVNVKDDASHFIPFVIEPYAGAEGRSYLKAGRVSFISIARFIDWKKHHILIDAIAPLAKSYDFHLTIIGEIGDEKNQSYYEFLTEKISSLGLSDRVTLYANIPHKDIFEKLLEADVFVLASNEAIPIAPLEALSCGLPAIVSDTAGKACYIHRGDTGYVFRMDDVEDLRSCLKKFLDDPGAIPGMGERALNSVRTEFSFQRYFDEITRL